MFVNTGLDVLVIGEALIDVVETHGTTTEHVGGSPANVALGLGRLGVRVALLTQLGEDRHGEMIVERLRESGVLVLPQSYVLEKTSSATARIAQDGHADYEFDIEWKDAFRSFPVDAPVVHIGSVSAFLEPGASTVRRLLRAQQPRIITYDPNVRGDLMPPRAAALDAFEQAAAMATIVKMSDEDASWLYPGKTPDAVLDEVLAWGARLVAITRGGEGAIVSSTRARVSVPGVEVQPVDTIGAGDTFMASLIASVRSASHGFDQAEKLQQIGEAAASAAAVTVSRAGADLPWASELMHR